MKKRISIILSIILIAYTVFLPCSVKADTNYPKTFDSYKRGVQGLKDALDVDMDRTTAWTLDQMFTVLQGIGFYVNPTNFDQKWNLIKEFIKNTGLFGVSSDASDQEVLNGINSSFYDSTVITDSEINFNQYGTDLKTLADYYASQCGYYYAYSFAYSDNVGWFSTVNQYNEYIRNAAAINFGFKGGQYCIGVYPNNVSSNFAFVGAYNNVGGLYPNVVQGISFVDRDTGVTIKDLSGFQVNQQGTLYGYTPGSNGVTGIKMSLSPSSSFGTSQGTYLFTGSSQKFKVYNSVQDILYDDLGQSPYYTDNSYSNNSGVINSGTYKPVTYGDITNYINSFNTENGSYPSPNEINIYINNYVPDNPSNPDNPSGGGDSGSGSGSFVNNNQPVFNNNPSINVNLGGGSGGTVSGNGIGGIFDFLGTIGSLLGDLIKGIGEALVGILEGITSAVQVVVEGIPNVLAPLIGFVFEGLPEEITALMTLGITAVLLIAIVKAIRK